MPLKLAEPTLVRRVLALATWHHHHHLTGMMVGGYNVQTLVELLDDAELAADATVELKVC